MCTKAALERTEAGGDAGVVPASLGQQCLNKAEKEGVSYDVMVNTGNLTGLSHLGKLVGMSMREFLDWFN